VDDSSAEDHAPGDTRQTLASDVGARVQLAGLTSERGRAQNGKYGVIGSFDDGRCIVTLEDGAIGKYRLANLEYVSAPVESSIAEEHLSRTAPFVLPQGLFAQPDFSKAGLFKEGAAETSEERKQRQFLERRAKKDAKVIAAAVGRQPATATAPSISTTSKRQAKKAARQRGNFKGLQVDICYEIIAMLKAETASDQAACVKHGTRVLEMVKPTISAGVIDPETAEALRFSARALLSLGRFEETVAASTDSLAILEQGHQGKKASETYCEVLYLRGLAEKHLGDLSAAHEDLLAACALERSKPLVSTQSNEKLIDLIGVMALRKQGSPRPHYTPKEQSSHNKQLRLQKYSPEDYCCSLCGVSGYAEIHPAALLTCEGCSPLIRWYCSKDCQVGLSLCCFHM
jgi:hypothetical protein